MVPRWCTGNQGNLGLASRGSKWYVSNKDANRNPRKSKSGQPRLPNGTFLIRMLIGNKRNLCLASQGSQMVCF